MRVSLLDGSETGAGWTSEVLQDSLLYREHAAGKNASAGTGAPTLDDLRLAIEAKVEYTASSTLSKEVRFVVADCHLRRLALPRRR